MSSLGDDASRPAPAAGVAPAPTPLGDGAPSDPSKTHRTIIEHARSAASKERSMTLLQGLRLYPKAVGWSVLISTCIVMEGYDISLVNNFCMPALLCP